MEKLIGRVYVQPCPSSRLQHLKVHGVATQLAVHQSSSASVRLPWQLLGLRHRVLEDRNLGIRAQACPYKLFLPPVSVFQLSIFSIHIPGLGKACYSGNKA